MPLIVLVVKVVAESRLADQLAEIMLPAKAYRLLQRDVNELALRAQATHPRRKAGEPARAGIASVVAR